MPNEELIHRFYTAFKQRDFRSMQNLYHAEAQFSDPVFQNLDVTEVKAMWQMLLTSAQDLKVVYKDVKADDKNGRCHWEAWYTFTATGKKVHNIIEAEFEFKDGLIYRHNDTFSFWRWTRMALGLPGYILGWTPLLQNKVRQTARKRLDSFLSKNLIK